MDLEGDPSASRWASRRAQYKRTLVSDPDKRRFRTLERQSRRRAEIAEKARGLMREVAEAEAAVAETATEAAAEAAVGEIGHATRAGVVPAVVAVETVGTPDAQTHRDARMEEDAGGARAVERRGARQARSDAAPGSALRASSKFSPGYAGTRFFANQLQVPEWLTCVPYDLNGTHELGLAGDGLTSSGWMVSPRPEGRHVLLVAANGWTQVRDVHGQWLGRFQSALLGGSARAPAHMSGTILDCIFNETTQTFHVADMMVWRGKAYYDHPYDFRRFWVSSNITEFCVDEVRLPPGHIRNPLRATMDEHASDRRGPTAARADSDDVMAVDDAIAGSKRPDVAAAGSRPPTIDINEYRIVPLPLFECDTSGIREAYQFTFESGETKDGLLFFNKAGLYEPGLTPLVLRWRDESTSSRAARPDARIAGVLQVGAEGTALCTQDEIDVVPIPAGTLSTLNLSVGDLVCVSCARARLNPDSTCTLVEPRIEGRPSRRRYHADSWSKLLFQSMQLESPVTIMHILGVAARTIIVPPPKLGGDDDDDMLEDDAV